MRWLPRRRISKSSPRWRLRARQAIAATAEAIARIDVAAGHAERAAEGGWCRPIITDEACFEIEGGRHPVVEAALTRSRRAVRRQRPLARPFRRLWLITGPNMGGKSTSSARRADRGARPVRSFVPAARATVGLVDRLFSRVGASDNLARGRSTFMVEMVETAAILAQATPQSLVILDEIGRGTSTYDGLAIAWAVVEAMHDQVQCRDLFATHYHELPASPGGSTASRSTMSGRANGRATWSFFTKSPTAPPTAATDRSREARRPAARGRWPRALRTREARGGT